MMNAKDYRAHLDRLGMTQLGAAAFLDVGPRTSRRWASFGSEHLPVPLAAELLLRVMVAKGLTPEAVWQLAKRKLPPEGFADRRAAG
jgi:hypothetical protein